MDIGDQCSICLEAGEGSSTLALPCRHRFHAACLSQVAGLRTPTRRGTVVACPNCRKRSLVAPFAPAAAFGVGDAVLALWGHRWYPGVVEEVVDGGQSYEIVWDDGDVGRVLASRVRRNPAQPLQDDSDSGDDAAPNVGDARSPPRAERSRENAQSPRMPHVRESSAAARSRALAGDLAAIRRAYANEQARKQRKERKSPYLPPKLKGFPVDFSLITGNKGIVKLATGKTLADALRELDRCCSCPLFYAKPKAVSWWAAEARKSPTAAGVLTLLYRAAGANAYVFRSSTACRVAKSTARRAKFLLDNPPRDDDVSEKLALLMTFHLLAQIERGVTIPLKIMWREFARRFEPLAEWRRTVGDGWDYHDPLQTCLIGRGEMEKYRMMGLHLGSAADGAVECAKHAMDVDDGQDASFVVNVDNGRDLDVLRAKMGCAGIKSFGMYALPVCTATAPCGGFRANMALLRDAGVTTCFKTGRDAPQVPLVMEVSRDLYELPEGVVEFRKASRVFVTANWLLPMLDMLPSSVLADGGEQTLESVVYQAIMLGAKLDADLSVWLRDYARKTLRTAAFPELEYLYHVTPHCRARVPDAWMKAEGAGRS